MAGMPTMSTMNIGTVIDLPNTGGPTYTTVYTDLCTFYWHPGVFLKIDNPKNNASSLTSLGEGTVLTTNRAIRSSSPSGGTSGWLTNGTAGNLANSIYLTYQSKIGSQNPVTHNTMMLDATGTVGGRQANYPAEEKIVINRYAATGCSVSTNAQREKYKKSYAYNQPIKGNYFNQSKWVKFCYDYNMTTFSDVNVSYYDSQTEALKIRRIKNRVPVATKQALTVNPIPANATVTFATSGYVVGNSILVDPNTAVTYTVSLSNYQTVTNSTTVTTSKSVTVTLEPTRGATR